MCCWFATARRWLRSGCRSRAADGSCLRGHGGCRPLKRSRYPIFTRISAVPDKQLPVEIIFLTAYRERSFFNQALDLGARGYILKDSAVTDIVSGIRAVMAGEHFTCPAMTSYLINRSGRGRHDTPQDHLPAGVKDLTHAERQVLKLIAAYKTSKEIADELCISLRTVERHRLNIGTKLGPHGSNALLTFALENKRHLL